MAREYIDKHLKAAPLFSSCTDDELREISRLSTPMQFKTGEVLAREGHAGHELVVILEGNAQVSIGGKHIATLGPGDFFGEVSLLDGGPRTATVTAESEIDAEVISRREFASLLEAAPSIARKLLEGLATRLRRADAKLFD
jgi:CRP-like cAMP-binding protein